MKKLLLKLSASLISFVLLLSHSTFVFADTLPTVYSTPTSTASGLAQQAGQDTTLATLRGMGGSMGSYDVGSNNIDAALQASTTNNQYQSMWRGIFCFDASGLADNATITAATVSLYFDTKVTNLGTTTVELVSATPASYTAIAAGDFDAIGSTSFASVSPGVVGSYVAFNLSAAGYESISKTGKTCFALRTGWDYNNNTTGVSWGSNQATHYMYSDGGYTEQTRDPKLDITYTPGPTGPANVKVFNGLAIASVGSKNGLATASVKTVNGLN